MPSDRKVFLSSTIRDLKEYREAAIEAINGLDGYKCIAMEKMGANPKKPDEICASVVGECDLFVGIIGHLYGSCPDRESKSYVEIEYDKAIDANIPCLIFFAANDFPISEKLIEKDEWRKRQGDFRKKLSKNVIRAEFSSPQDLAMKIIQAICNYEKKMSSKKPVKNPNFKPKLFGDIEMKDMTKIYDIDDLNPEDFTIKITVPQGFTIIGTNNIIKFNDWLSNPIGIGNDPASREYPLKGEILPHVLGIVVEIWIKTDDWYPQCKCFVDADGKFSGSIWLHRSLPPAIFRFDILNNGGKRLKRIDTRVD